MFNRISGRAAKMDLVDQYYIICTLEK